MKVVVKHLQRDKKTGLLSYRRRFPTELVPYIPSDSRAGKGRTELKYSLRSANMSDPIARARYAEAEQQFEEIVSRAERIATGSYDSLDGDLIRRLAQQYVYDHLEADEAMRWKRPQRPAIYATRGGPEDLYDESRALLEGYDLEGLRKLWGPWARTYSEALGFHIDPSDPEFSSLCRALAEAACEVWLAIDKRIDEQSVPTPAAPEKLQRQKWKPVSSAQAQSLMGLYEQYAAVPDRSPKTIAQWRTYIQHLVNFLGTDDVEAVTHDSLVAWSAHLETSVHKGKHLAPKTINGSYMGSVCALFAWARSKSLVTSNPTLEVGKVKRPQPVKTRTKAFTNNEALAVLRASLTPTPSREGEHLRNAKRWCPWLMAYSGARVNEITQLRKEDIFERDEVWVMRITPEAGTVKSKKYRLVPLHSHLVDQGFLDFVNRRGDGPLFYDPSKRRSDNAINRQPNVLGTKLAAWVRSLGINGVSPNHAWRHYFLLAAVRYELDPPVRKAIMGHASSDVHEKVYLDGLVEMVDVLARELEKIPRFEVEELRGDQNGWRS